MANENINADFIERFQLIYQNDPKSKVFAPLAEAYRRMGYHKVALEICERGVTLHPQFPSGHMALAKIYLDQNRLEEAVKELKATAELSPENITAQSLLAESFMKLKRPKDALKAFKMVLFLNPRDEKAQKSVQRLESLTADEFDEDVFEMAALPTAVDRINAIVNTASTNPVNPQQDPNALPELRKQRSMERFLSLADAFIVRNDVERASGILKEAETQIGEHPEIGRRKKIISSRIIEPPPITIPDKENLHRQARLHTLNTLLRKIEERKSQLQ